MSTTGDKRGGALRDTLVRERPHGKSIGASILARTLADRRVLLRKSLAQPARFPEASAEWPVSGPATGD